jgi:mediator of RNA polymerase II transcription subunit 7
MAWAPNPPNFYKQFTTENLTRLDELKKEHENSTNASQLLHLPPELRYLIPPEPPQNDDPYRLFGQVRTTKDYLASLQEMGIKQLYNVDVEGNPLSNLNDDESANASLDRVFHLKSLSRSVMLSFLEMVGMLAENPLAEVDRARERERVAEINRQKRPGEELAIEEPTGWARKAKDINQLYLNTLHLINEYRPHQARESLILRMEEDVEKGRKEVEDVKKLKEKVEAMIKDHDGLIAGDEVLANGHGVQANGVNGDKKKSEQELRDEDVQKAIWDVLNTEFPRLAA